MNKNKKKREKRFGSAGTAGLTLFGIGASLLAGSLISKGVEKAKYVDIDEDEDDILDELEDDDEI